MQVYMYVWSDTYIYALIFKSLHFPTPSTVTLCLTFAWLDCYPYVLVWGTIHWSVESWPYPQRIMPSTFLNNNRSSVKDEAWGTSPQSVRGFYLAWPWADPGQIGTAAVSSWVQKLCHVHRTASVAICLFLCLSHCLCFLSWALEGVESFPFRTERSLSSQNFDQLWVYTLTAAHWQKKLL